MSHRWIVLIVFSSLACVPSGGWAQDYVDYVRDWMIMGTNNGQRQADATQYHTEGYTQCFNTDPSWCNDLTPGG